MAKATHQGECQVCGATQKLPSGILSIHGYTIAHGWQSGTCSGSRKLPYELSCDVIQDSIDYAKSRLSSLRELRKTTLSVDSTTTNQTWARIYSPEHSSRTRGSVSVWKQVTVVADDSVRRHHYLAEGNEKHKAPWSHTLAELVQKGNDNYASYLSLQIAQIQSYLMSQLERKNNWTLKPLTPIKGA